MFKVRESEAKECLSCLRRAAGMFSFVGTNLSMSFLFLQNSDIRRQFRTFSGRLSGTGEIEGSDFDMKVGRAYELQVRLRRTLTIIATQKSVDTNRGSVALFRSSPRMTVSFTISVFP